MHRSCIQLIALHAAPTLPSLAGHGPDSRYVDHNLDVIDATVQLVRTQASHKCALLSGTYLRLCAQHLQRKGCISAMHDHMYGSLLQQHSAHCLLACQRTRCCW